MWTKKKINKEFPDFEITEGGSVRHIPSGKQSVCILDEKVSYLAEFVKNVVENPEVLNMKSYFRHVDPTHEAPFSKGDKVLVTASDKELGYWLKDAEERFGLKPGVEIEIESVRWSDNNAEWQPLFDGFWLRNDMYEVVK